MLFSKRPVRCLRASGFQSGPAASQPGFASVAAAKGEMRYLNGYTDRQPSRTGLSIADSIAAMFVVIATLATLRARDSNAVEGHGVDVSLLESVVAMMESVVPAYAATGVVRGPTWATLPGVAPSNVYRNRDGQWSRHVGQPGCSRRRRRREWAGVLGRLAWLRIPTFGSVPSSSPQIHEETGEVAARPRTTMLSSRRLDATNMISRFRGAGAI